MACLGEPHGEVKVECQQRERGPEAHAIVSLHGCSALGFRGYGEIAQFKPKGGWFIKPCGVLCKGQVGSQVQGDQGAC